jgi:hypothetical protein|tara:strand:- start:178 stop:318 length:141 start_codon:yes stop_codon:yes gene_type:complete
MKKVIRWFELNLGWFFINGFKRDDWEEYLKEKYKKTNNMFEGPTKL